MRATTPGSETGARTPRRRDARTTGLPELRFAGLELWVIVLVETVGGGLGLAIAAAGLARRRTRARSRRRYGRYPLLLSLHDEAKPQDLEDTIEAIANLVRVFPTERARHGQPFIAFELRHELGPSGALEWSILVRCEPTIAAGVDSALSAAYPDVRLGPDTPHDESATPLPGHVMRFRKRRGFVYPLVADGDALASPPLEAIAHAQAALAVPSVVRFGLTPAPVCWESIARWSYRRHENKLIRSERWGLPEGGLTSTLNRAEMANAGRTQNRSLFWLECVIAADGLQSARRLAATVQARRGENRLQRRWMPVRHNLYRRRFAAATPPLLPSPRSLISASEAAHLLALPTARMKGVPVRRAATPRISMPPEIQRADPDLPVPTAVAAELAVAVGVEIAT